MLFYMTVVNGSFVFPRGRTFHLRTPQDFVFCLMTQTVWNPPETLKRAPFEVSSVLLNFSAKSVWQFKLESVRLFVCPTNLFRLHRLQ